MSTQCNTVFEALGICYLQDIYDLIPHTSCNPPCCNSFCYWGLNIFVLSSSNFLACATSLHFNGMLIPGMAARATLITLPQALRPAQTALRLCLAQQKAWVSQADVLLTKHQQAKSLWPHKHQPAKSLWPHTQDKAAEGKTGH